MWTIYNNYLSKSFIIIIFFFMAYVTKISRKRFSVIMLSLDFEAFFYLFRKTESRSTRTDVKKSSP